MRLTEAHAKLMDYDARHPGLLLTTHHATRVLGVNEANASTSLRRLAETEHVVMLERGKWILPHRISPQAVVMTVALPYDGYLSLWSALHHYDMIDQVPARHYGMTTGRTRLIETPAGGVSLHHVTPAYMGAGPTAGFARDAAGYWIATPEQALVDTLYLRKTKGKRFASLPELTLPRRFRISAVEQALARIASSSHRTFVRRELEHEIERARSHGKHRDDWLRA
jgi:predicted transcriptional regulator of viral defense system